MCKKIIALLLSLLLLCLTAAAFASEAVLTLRDVTPEGNYKNQADPQNHARSAQ